jgi:uncharacterized protein YjbI with pentapeptide repeats
MRNLKWWAVGIAAVALVIVVGVIIYGYRTKPGWVGVSGKTVWDYLELLIVLAALAIGAAWLTGQQRERELAVEDQRAKDEALQTYINTMGTRLEDLRTAFHDYQKAVFDIKEQEDHPSPGLTTTGRRRNDAENERNLETRKDTLEHTRTLIRAYTRTVLEQVDGPRKRQVMRLLSESELLDKVAPTEKRSLTTIQLDDADFGEADLTYMNLANKNLQGVRFAHANLSSANLEGADLRRADLSYADLTAANLGTARKSIVPQDPQDRGLETAPLNQANLAEADLSHANLRHVTGVSEGQFTPSKSLKGATMPDGIKHP